MHAGILADSVGSSPLARGLHGWNKDIDAKRGIIPARAGFTNSSVRYTANTTDHPRSRGVYRPRVADYGFKVGSSPLARGLQPQEKFLELCAGIIPARAGFTFHLLEDDRVLPDHPRSRGVYQPEGIDLGGQHGSSPLARGLLRRRELLLQLLRIIPARAGFTCGRGLTLNQAWDHPRSRGVYRASLLPARAIVGSSPLARGLQAGETLKTLAGRIIPARAGFTFRLNTLHSKFRDHPRSRGVYRALELRKDATRGSSPLARGLPKRNTHQHRTHGIIPARAGFTPQNPLISSSIRGSSPLARGLQLEARVREALNRIIPARAGFTVDDFPSRLMAADHPRSRGVYHMGSPRENGVWGSSPLARGLRRSTGPQGSPGRIIPARAGFTRAGPHEPVGGGDHPRSRGVYTDILDIPYAAVGSSPLARGLRRRLVEAFDQERIIPARAGFTGHGQRARRRWRDHPRSRGVYSDRHRGR